jgi:hypothetical protein
MEWSAWVFTWWPVILGVLVNAVMLYLQIRTYRRVRHQSFAVLSIGSGLGIIYPGYFVVCLMLGAPMSGGDYTHTLLMMFVTAQCVIGVYGSVGLFHAFEASLAKDKPEVHDAK